MIRLISILTFLTLWFSLSSATAQHSRAVMKVSAKVISSSSVEVEQARIFNFTELNEGAVNGFSIQGSAQNMPVINIPNQIRLTGAEGEQLTLDVLLRNRQVGEDRRMDISYPGERTLQHKDTLYRGEIVANLEYF